MCRLLGLRCCLTVLTCVSCGCALFANQPGPPPPPATQPIVPTVEASDGYKAISGWESAGAAQSEKVKFCAILYRPFEDKIGDENCRKKLAIIRAAPEKLSSSHHYFCMYDGRKVVTVPVEDRMKIESFPKGRNLCMWFNGTNTGSICTFERKYRPECAVQIFDTQGSPPLWIWHIARWAEEGK